jgi:hypothetical protein
MPGNQHTQAINIAIPVPVHQHPMGFLIFQGMAPFTLQSNNVLNSF